MLRRQDQRQLQLRPHRKWVHVVVVVLNYTYSNRKAKSQATTLGPATTAQLRSLSMIAAAVVVMLEVNPEAIEKEDWEAVIHSRSVGYDGDEVGHAERLTVAQVLPTLPPAGVAGSLDADLLATGFVKEALVDPSLVILLVGKCPAVPRHAKVWAPDCVWHELCHELWKLKLVEPIAEKDIFTVHGVPVLKRKGDRAVHELWQLRSAER